MINREIGCFHHVPFAECASEEALEHNTVDERKRLLIAQRSCFPKSNVDLENRIAVESRKEIETDLRLPPEQRGHQKA